jgi:serine/threonine protein kinase
MSDEIAAPADIEDLVEEFLGQLQRGEKPSLRAFQLAHPHLAAEIGELFPVVAAMEGWKEQETAEQGGRNSLGGVPIDRLGDFRMVREIGRGGMGIVFEAIQESLQRRVAIKILPPLDSPSGGSADRFRNEAMTAAALHHSNIVPVFGIGHENGFNYIVMQLIDGCGLDSMLKKRGDRSTRDRRGEVTQCVSELSASPRADSQVGVQQSNPLLRRDGGLEPRLVARLGVQAAEAIHYAHENGTLHRDIKPANLLLDRKGHLWVADFGLAKALEHQALSHSGDIVGTLLYMAPERLRGRCDVRSDVYGLGITLLELVLGQPVFEPADSGALIDRILRGLDQRGALQQAAIPIDLKTILSKAMAVDPQDRYDSAALLAEDLQAFVDDLPIQARRATRVETLRRMCRRNPVVAGLTASVVGLLIITLMLTSLGFLQQRRMRNRTQATLDTTLQTLDKIYDKFGGPRGDVAGSILSGAVLSDEAADMLAELLTVYDELASQGGDTAQLQRESLLAEIRVADIHLRLGAIEQAVDHYRRAAGGIAALRYADDDDAYFWQLKRAHTLSGWASASELGGDAVLAKQLRGDAIAGLADMDSRWADDPGVLLAMANLHYLDGRSVERLAAVSGRRFTGPLDRPRREGDRDGPPHRRGDGPGDRPIGRRGFDGEDFFDWLPPSPRFLGERGPRPFPNAGDGPPPDRPDDPNWEGFDRETFNREDFSREENNRDDSHREGGNRGDFNRLADRDDAHSNDRDMANGPAMDRGRGIPHFDQPPRPIEFRFPAEPPALPPSDEEKDRLASLRRCLDLLGQVEPTGQLRNESTLLRALALRELAALARNGSPDSATQIAKSIELLQNLVEQNPESADYQFQLARTFLQAIQLQSVGKPDNVARDESYLKNAHTMLARLHDSQPQVPEYAALLAQVSLRLAMANERLSSVDGATRGRRFAEAEALLQQAIRLQSALVEKNPTGVVEQLWMARYEISWAQLTTPRRTVEDVHAELDATEDRLRSLAALPEAEATVADLIAEIEAIRREPGPPTRNFPGRGFR